MVDSIVKKVLSEWCHHLKFAILEIQDENYGNLIGYVFETPPERLYFY